MGKYFLILITNLERHSAINVDGTKIFVFGGCDGTDYSNDLLVIDTESNSWVREKTQGTKPAPRSGHSCVLYNNALYVFGGGNDYQLFNDLFKLDLDTLTWSSVTIHGNTDSAKRIHHSANVIANKMVVFGGLLSSHSNDLMVLDLEHARWDVEHPRLDRNSHPPPSLLGHTTQLSGTKLWIVGGKYNENDNTVISSNVYTLETGIRGIDPIDCGRSTLTTDLHTLIDNEEYSDVTLDYNGQFYFAHKPIIYVRCPLLYRECIKGTNDVVNVCDAADALMKKKKHKIDEIINLRQKDDKIKSAGFHGFLEFIYTDRVGLLEGEDIGELDIKSCIMELIFLSVAFSMDRLFGLCSKHLDSSNYHSIPPPTLYSDMNRLYESTEKTLQMAKDTDLLSPIQSLISKSFFDATPYSAPQSEDDSSEAEDDDNYSISSPMSTSSTQDGGNIFSTVLSSYTFLQSPEHSYCDVIFSVGLDQTKIPVHRCILMSRSKFFRRMLQTPAQQHFIIGSIKIDEYELTGIRAEAFKLVVQYLYTGNVSVNFDISVELLIAAEIYQLERLSLICQSVIEKKIHPGNVSTILGIADSYDVKHLRDTCTYFIVHNMSKVRKTNNYKKELSSDLKHELKELRKYYRQQEGSVFYEQSEYSLPFSSYYHTQYASSSYTNKQKKKQKNKQKQSAVKKVPQTPNSAPVIIARKKIRKQSSLVDVADDPHEEVSYLSEPASALLGISPPSPFSPLVSVAEYHQNTLNGSSPTVPSRIQKRRKQKKKLTYH